MYLESAENLSPCGALEIKESGDSHFKRVSPDEMIFSKGSAMHWLWQFWSRKESSCNQFGVPIPNNEIWGEEEERLKRFLEDQARARVEKLTDLECPKKLEEDTVVHLAEDGMTAWMLIFPPLGEGEMLTLPQICRVLVKNSILNGVNWELLRGLPTGRERYFCLFPIAYGTAPQSGKDGYVVDRYPRHVPSGVEIDELGQADYNVLNIVQEIKENEIICEIIPPTQGIPGKTVTGVPCPARDGLAAVPPQGRNTRLSEDGRYLVAEVDGHLTFTGHDFKVKPVLHLWEEEIHASHSIKYLGDIHIHCDLNPQSSVCAMGMVQIDGVAEGCTVEAGESIIASSGVQGQGTTVLRAQKNVYAKYLENCEVYAREGVYADCIINSSIYSNGIVRVCTGRGVIIGGTIRAAREVSAITVGSKAERATSVILGGDPCQEAEQMQIQQEIQGIEQALSSFEGRELDAQDQQKASKLRLKEYIAKMNLDKMEKDMESRRMCALSCDIRRLRCEIAYPGTSVTIDHGTYRVTRPEHSCTIGISCGRVGRL